MSPERSSPEILRQRRVTIVTSGHPSTCPRMVKAADAAVEAGFDVRLVSVDYIDWASAFDDDVVSRRHWQWRRVQVRRSTHPLRRLLVSARHRAARALVAPSKVIGSPMSVVVRAYARTHSELVRAILAEPFDFVYGGTVGALAAVAQAARCARRPFALDFEDLHTDESEEIDAQLTHELASMVVRSAHQGAAFLTAASLPMARQYEADLGIAILPIHNVVPRPEAPRFEVAREPLNLYWFSQTVGPRRGLEDVVAGVAAAGITAVLHLRGAGGDAYVAGLRRLASEWGADLTIALHGPAPADQMVPLCRSHDIGLSTEQPLVPNHDLCVSNKVLAYFAAGLAVVATDTRGHRSIAEHHTDAMTLYRPGDGDGLGRILRGWHADRQRLLEARKASWRAAEERWHWEHPRERGALVNAMQRAVP